MSVDWIPDVIVAGLLVYVLNRLSSLSDRVSKIEGLLEGMLLAGKGQAGEGPP